MRRQGVSMQRENQMSEQQNIFYRCHAAQGTTCQLLLMTTHSWKRRKHISAQFHGEPQHLEHSSLSRFGSSLSPTTHMVSSWGVRFQLQQLYKSPIRLQWLWFSVSSGTCKENIQEASYTTWHVTLKTEEKSLQLSSSPTIQPITFLSICI